MGQPDGSLTQLEATKATDVLIRVGPAARLRLSLSTEDAEQTSTPAAPHPATRFVHKLSEMRAGRIGKPKSNL